MGSERGAVPHNDHVSYSQFSVGTDSLHWPTLDVLRQRTSAKWRVYPPDVLPLFIAEMDTPLAEPVAKVLREVIARGDMGYAVGTAYAEALDSFAQERWGWDGIAAERAALVPDVMLGIVEVLKLVTEPGDAVVVNCPVYPPFYAFVEHMGRRVIESQMDAGYRIDFAALESAFQQAVACCQRAAFLLCNPHNPTGTVHTRQELMAVAQLAGSYGVRVIADEIHAPIVMPDVEHVPFLSLPGAENAFAVFSASKAWNLAGLKAALAVAGPEAADDLARMPWEVSHGPSHLGVIAHSAALRHGGAWLDSVLSALDTNRRLLGDLLAQHIPDVRYRQPDGTYLAWLDCRRLGLGADPAAVFLDRGRVGLTSGEFFGTGGAGHVRLTLATSPDILTEAVRRMTMALSSWPDNPEEIVQNSFN